MTTWAKAALGSAMALGPMSAAAGTVESRITAMAGDPAYGSYLAGGCAGCHGSAAIPPLRSYEADELIAALVAYREGSRRNVIMQAQARALGDEGIAALAAWLGDGAAD